jgi:hypothetical protein
VAGPCEYGNERLGSIKGGEYLGQLSDYKLFKDDPIPWSGIALGYVLDDPGFESRRGLGIFCSPRRPDRLWVPPSLLSNGYQGFFSWE